MHALILSVILAMAPSSTVPQNAVRDARSAVAAAAAEVEITRKHWDDAVAGDHPVPAGKWARRHFAAMQTLKAAEANLRTTERDAHVDRSHG